MLPLPPQYAIEPGTAPLASRRDTGAFWVVLALSVLVHVVALFLVPPLRFDLRPAGDPDAPLAVELRARPPAPETPASARKPQLTPPVAVTPPRPAPPPQQAEPPAIVATPPPAEPTVRPPRAARRARIEPPSRPPPTATPPRAEPLAPPVIAAVEPTPEPTPPVPAEPNAPERAAPSRGGDLSSHVEARRRARSEAFSTAPWRLEAPQADNEEARRNRIAAENLGVGRTPVFGARKQGGGLFQITRLYYGNAEFVFFGWNKDIRRNTTQTIEVRKGAHSDIRVAVIRRMIEIIREHESGDFLWVSDRLGRNVMLSARPADHAGLENFLWQEFFDAPRPDAGVVGRVQR